MLQSDILTLYDYNYWANARVLDASSQVTPEQFVAPARLSHGSLRGTLAHILGTEIVWRMRCQEGISPPAVPDEKDFLSLESLVSRWQDEEKIMRAFLQSLDEQALAGSVQYKTTRGVPYENTLWKLLVHVVNHGTQFRGEAGIVLTDYGHSPGDLDFLFFMRLQKR